ncbi:Kelch repeat-containing protein [Anaerobaca lacustris]|uniref:Kelch repeat-containing protein n=1 Tax=Anaerobaca lacustris TaxID=3044600 RepID=A0AAW6U7A0_9BACT|nr:kelch repeat-containing protein [Sedimentisphaerales bacterium M17dextr]
MKRASSYRTTVFWWVVAGSILLASGGSAWADFVWTQKADMPTGRWTQTSAVVNDKIYVIGGYPSEGTPGEAALSVVEEYDPAANAWTRKADMPTARCDFNASSAVVDGKIYVIGGTTYPGPVSSAVEEYDPATDTWTRKTDMPTPRWSVGTCVLDGKIYAIGGYPGGWTGLRTVEMYDPVTGTWARKADMPLGVGMLSARVVRGKIYAIGGRPGVHSEPWMQEYDPATDTWTRKADMPIDTSQMGAVVLGDKIVVFGGWEWSMNYPYTTVQMYDPEVGIWTKEADVPFLRAALTAEVVNDRIYAIGGTDTPHPCPALSTVFEFGPLLDFDGDWVVGIEDLVILIDSWGTDDLRCDIAPLLGDGRVDVLDLEALMSSWGQTVDDPTLIAHYRLDEAESHIAADSAGGYDGTLSGEPLWQPEGGQVGGALRFDGLDDYVATPRVLNPADGPFSVFAWVKGGGPGQVILSQEGGATWLCADPVTGCLMTELKGTGRDMRTLCSETVVTDGDWHRIGLVWDGDSRTLYVDDAVAAQDTQSGGAAACSGGLHLGCGSDQAPGTFFAGLIDDVRIYSRAVKP